MTATPHRPGRGVLYALAAALFGASTPFAKLIVGRADPVLLAGLHFLVSGYGLFAWRLVTRKRRATVTALQRPDLPGSAGRWHSAGWSGWYYSCWA